MLSVDPLRPDPKALAEAASVLRSGGLVAFPTETVYGLGAMATDPSSVRRIYEAKGRPSTNPLIVHVSDRLMAERLSRNWPEVADRLANAFWPGPLTLVLPRTSSVPDEVTGGRNTVGLRMPSAPVALGLIQAAGTPLAAPSANRSNRVSPTRAEHVLADLEGRIDLVLDAGPTTIGLESTVLDLSCETPYRILRPGPISAEDLAQVLGEAPAEPGGEVALKAGEPLLSPGLSAVHYSPETPAVRFEPGERIPEGLGRGCAYLQLGEERPDLPEGALEVIRLADPTTAGRELYSALHTLDRKRAGLIVVAMPPPLAAWRPIRDRLLRATRPFRGPLD